MQEWFRRFGNPHSTLGDTVEICSKIGFSRVHKQIRMSAEYECLLLGLRKARALGARRLSIKSDSELITNHIGKTYRAFNPELAKYLAAVRSMEFFFRFQCAKLPQNIE